jgi:hypothetical protein
MRLPSERALPRKQTANLHANWWCYLLSTQHRRHHALHCKLARCIVRVMTRPLIKEIAATNMFQTAMQRVAFAFTVQLRVEHLPEEKRSIQPVYTFAPPIEDHCPPSSCAVILIHDTDCSQHSSTGGQRPRSCRALITRVICGWAQAVHTQLCSQRPTA